MAEGVCSMSTFLPINSACERITSSIDIFDLELNPHGVQCCGECESIIFCRESWAIAFGYQF
jgi:hypothetical protein